MALPNLTLAPSSAAASDAASTVDAGSFHVDFGDKNAPDSAATGGVTGLGAEVIKGLVVALIVKLAMDKIFK